MRGHMWRGWSWTRKERKWREIWWGKCQWSNCLISSLSTTPWDRFALKYWKESYMMLSMTLAHDPWFCFCFCFCFLSLPCLALPCGGHAIFVLFFLLINWCVFIVGYVGTHMTLGCVRSPHMFRLFPSFCTLGLSLNPSYNIYMLLISLYNSMARGSL